jgi:hypothetical protein
VPHLVCHTQDIHATARARDVFEHARATLLIAFRDLCRIVDDPDDAEAEIVMLTRAMLEASR